MTTGFDVPLFTTETEFTKVPLLSCNFTAHCYRILHRYCSLWICSYWTHGSTGGLSERRNVDFLLRSTSLSPPPLVVSPCPPPPHGEVFYVFGELFDVFLKSGHLGRLHGGWWSYAAFPPPILAAVGLQGEHAPPRSNVITCGPDQR